MMKALRLHAEPLGPAEGGRLRAESASAAWRNPRLALEQVEKPEPAADELLIRVAYCGICGSDFHLADPSHDTLVYSGLAELPVTIGHEFSGEVVAHGGGLPEAVRARFPLGTLVTAEEMVWCGHCDACRGGHVNHCEELEELGFTSDGAQAEYIRVPARLCWSLEALRARHGGEAALRLGAVVEPYAVSYRALFQGAHGGRWVPGLRVLVVGCGPIGLAAVDLALLGGALCVHTLETEPKRRQLSLELGAELALPPDGAAALPSQYDWIIDAAGATGACLGLLHNHGAIGATLCVLARTDETAHLQPETLITRNARVVGSQGHSGESAFRRVIELMGAGRTQAELLVREVISVEEALSRLQRQEKCEGKTLVQYGSA